jgi:type IV secretory pathway VirB6-like protein
VNDKSASSSLKSAKFAASQATDENTNALIIGTGASALVNMASQAIDEDIVWGDILEGVSGVSAIVFATIMLVSFAANMLHAWNSAERVEAGKDAMSPDDAQLASYVIDTKSVDYQNRVSTLELLAEKYRL